MHFCTSDIFYSFVEAVEIFNKTLMCRIKSEIYSTKVGWTWASWAKSRIGPIWGSHTVTHMGLPMWGPHGTVLQIPSQSHMGCPYRTHIKFHMGPLLVPYLLLTADWVLHTKFQPNIPSHFGEIDLNAWVDINFLGSTYIFKRPLWPNSATDFFSI